MKHQTDNKNKGTTMVETIAAFTVLAVILAALYHIVKFSSDLRVLAVDTAHLNQLFLREVYKNDDMIDTSFVQMKSFTPGTAETETDSTVVFWLELDTSEDHEEMYQSYLDHGNKVPTAVSQEDESTEIELPIRFRLNCMGAKSYLCIDELVRETNEDGTANKKSEQIPAPAMMNFMYVTPEVPETEGQDQTP